VPHSVGGWKPSGGGGEIDPIRWNMPPILPSGVQHAIAIRPSGRHTRRISSAVRLWSGANMCPKHEMTRSKLSSSKGRFWASPSIQSTSTIESAPYSRAILSRSGAKSSPVTRAASFAAGTVALPVPQATSSTSIPGSICARSTTVSPAEAILSATAL
jgi:hypothetical protein